MSHPAESFASPYLGVREDMLRNTGLSGSLRPAMEGAPPRGW